jgi:uncharacterized protein YdcH (DUF465 family)
MESDQLRQRNQELEETQKLEHHRCHEFTAQGKKAERRLKQLLNDHANTKFDYWRNKKNWMSAVERDDEELKQMIHAMTLPRSGGSNIQAGDGVKEAADNLVANMQRHRSANQIKPDGVVEHIGGLRRRSNSASGELVGIGVQEKVLKEDIARHHINKSLLERDLKYAEIAVKGMHEAANKEASQFQQYERQKQSLEDEIEAAQKKETNNYENASQIKAKAFVARKEAKEKLYMGELEVRRLDAVLRETKERTAEHIADTELLQEWETRLPVAHLNQYKMADDQFYKLVAKHHELNATLREVLDSRQAEFEATGNRNLDATPEFGL